MVLNKNIDVVIAWVDGADVNHVKKRQAFSNKPIDLGSVRYSDNGEIYYCIASLLKYAKFFNKIYLVTDKQVPKYLKNFFDEGICEKNKIHVVDHEEIFSGYEHHLPTFNSLSIESMLWRIPGLSDNYVYMNDDFFINQGLDPEYLFDNDMPVLRGCYSSMFKFQLNSFFSLLLGQKIRRSSGFTYSQMCGANVAGMAMRYFRFDHQPHPINKKTQADFFENNPLVLDGQIKYRFRSSGQFNPISLVNHLMIQRREASLKPSADIAYFKPKMGSLFDFEIKKLAYQDVKFGCLQGLDLLSDSELKKLRVAMHRKFDGYLPNRLLEQSEG
jgi:hypothetical protein